MSLDPALPPSLAAQLKDYERRIAALERSPARLLHAKEASNSVSNITLDTTLTSRVSLSFTTPEWANTAIVIARSNLQLTNSSGSAVILRLRTDIEGVPGSGAFNVTGANGEIASLTNTFNRLISDPPSIIDVDGVAAIDTGTNTANIVDVGAAVIYMAV